MVMIATCIPAIAFAESKAAPLTIWDVANKELTDQTIEMIAIYGQKELRAKDAEGKLVSPTWTSSNPSVLQVSQSGLVTTVKPKVGEEVTITATDQNGNQAKCHVTLIQMDISDPDVFLINRGKPKKVSLNKATAILASVPRDQTSTAASESRAAWFADNLKCIESTNEKVVKSEDVAITKSTTGQVKLNVTAIADGNTELTFTLEDQEFATGKATLEIQTKTGIILSKTYTSLSAGEESKIPIKEVLPADNNPEPQFQYTSEDPAVATVDQDGVVKGIANGGTNIEIKQTNGQQYTTSYRVTVVKPGLYIVEGGHENTSDMSKWKWVGDTLSINTQDEVYLRYFTKDSASDGLGTLYQSGNANVGSFVSKEAPGEDMSYKRGYFKPAANGSAKLRLMEYISADDDYRELGECTVTVNVPGFSNAATGNREDYKAQGPQNGTTLKLNDLHISTNTSNQLMYENYINTLVDTKDSSFSFTAASAKGDGNKKPDDYVQKYMLDKIKLCNKEMTKTIGTFGDETLILKSVDTNKVQNPTTVKFAIKKEALKYNTEYALVFDDSFKQNSMIEKEAVFYFKTKKFTKATAISLNKPSANIPVNGTLELKASFMPKDADDTELTWSSTDHSVAKVDNSGNVTGVKAGTAIITAVNKNGLSSSCKVTVDPVQVAPAKIKAAAAAYNSAKISWEKVNGAAGYAVYGAASKNGKYGKLTETKAFSYLDKGLKTGKTKYYKVRTYTEVNGVKYYSADSNISAAKPALKPIKKVKAQASYNKATVSYQQIPGASGYMIYKASKKNGAYKKLAVVKGGKNKSFTDKKVKTGKTYYYKVKAYRNVDGRKVYSKISKPAGAKAALAVSKMTLKAKKNGIVVKWTKVKGAHKYQIYRSTKKNGGYILVRQTAKRSFTDQQVSDGKAYFYKLRAYRVVDGKKVYSKYTKIQRVKAK